MVLIPLLVLLFIQSFKPGWILFVNDTTLGQMMAAPNRLPAAFAGTWHYGVWVGMEGAAAAPSISALLTMLLTPAIFLKVFVPFCMFFLGFSAWVFFRQLKFHPAVCALGGIAAALNMHFFSVACWGQGSWIIAAGMIFLALAALSSTTMPLWSRGILAGLALGINLMEGFDVGAILCIFVGFFILWQIFTSEAPGAKRVIHIAVTEVLVIAFSALIAAHSISTLVGTQVVGVVGTSQDAETKEKRWNPDTQWSLPKLETLRIISPGLFGYRMAGRITTPDKSSAYWGTVGQDPRLDMFRSDDPAVRAAAAHDFVLPEAQREQLLSPDKETRNSAMLRLLAKPSTVVRYSGSGEYAGMLVSILAIFGIVNGCRGDRSPFSRPERRSIWFWTGAAVFSLLASWGRHAFFYHLLYELPYVSTIRNPIKFMHPFHLAWVILAAYGMEALWRRYLQTAAPRGRFEKNWALSLLVLAGLSVIGLYVYYTWKPHLVAYLESLGTNADRSLMLASFSVVEAGWMVFWLAVSVAVINTIIRGRWTGPGARTAWLLLGAIMILDLTRSDVPWIHYFNYEQEYASNDIVDVLKDKPYEHRVTCRLSPKGLGSGIATRIGQVYDYWQQNVFPYYKLQSLDFSQWPRTPELDATYMKNFALHGDDMLHTDLWPSERLWQLTNTRYIVTSASFILLLNQDADTQHHFDVKSFLNVVPKPGVESIEDAGDLTVTPDPAGSYAFIEFSNTLPRAKLYSNWQSPTNDAATLALLVSRRFDPGHTVLISHNTPLSQPPGDPKASAGDVTITDYRPKRVRLQAHAATPAVLLLNDRIAPEWSVTVDQKPAPVLRCNYIMRGVYLTPGDHTIEFKFRPSLTSLYVSLCGWGIGILTSAFLIYSRPGAPLTVAAPIPTPAPPSAPVPADAAPGATDKPQVATKTKPKRRKR